MAAGSVRAEEQRLDEGTRMGCPKVGRLRGAQGVGIVLWRKYCIIRMECVDSIAVACTES